MPDFVNTNLYGVSVGTTSTDAFITHFNTRDPTAQDLNFPIQKRWVNTVFDREWILEGFATSNGVVTAVWSQLSSGTLGVETLQGNTGAAVPPDASHNIHVVGDGTFITVAGNPATNTLTISPAGGLTTLYTEDTGTATPSAGNLNVSGGAGIKTAGSGNTITISGNGQAINYTNVTHAMSPYTVLVTDFYISVDCSGGVVTLRFPNVPTAKYYWIVKDRTGNAATNNITITTVSGVVTLDGQTSLIMDSNYMALNLLANSTPTYEVF